MITGKPVDVISVCTADGEIRPLRLRVADEQQFLMRVEIDEILDIKRIEHVGVESSIFICRGNLWGRSRVFQLKYTYRSHCWRLCGGG